MRRATIYEVAKLAGVSHMTVSRYLRKEPSVRPENALRVARAIEELGYRPSPVAQAMRTGCTHRIAALLPDPTTAVPIRMLDGAARAARDAGYLLDVVALDGDLEARAGRLDSLIRPGSVDAVLSFTPLPEGVDALLQAALGVPVVVDGEYDDNMRARGVLADAAPMIDIVRHLADLGHRRFLHVAGPAAWASARNRRAVYESQIAALGLESCAVVEGDFSIKSGWDAAVSVIAHCGATAVIAANDRSAIGVVQGLHSVGVSVPRQVSVFGWNDDEMGRYLSPTLSTVSVNRERQGREAVDRLLALLRGTAPDAPPDAAALNRLVLRQSTAAAPL
ncbi:LacI family DNA-binding transcriptional regulator [Streptomyces zhihengii]|uniref:LacI family DNA-binding transcriptional regulator n=1 Tax=Streptomyces zhihengii TaxID=1818004 RepID=UPI0033BC1EAC